MTGEKKDTTPAETQPQKSSAGKGNKAALSVLSLCLGLTEGGVACVSQSLKKTCMYMYVCVIITCSLLYQP